MCVKWFSLYELLEWAKLFYGEKNPNSDFSGVQEQGQGLTRKGQEEILESDGSVLHVDNYSIT